jgi:probable rRNA maturation factor
MATGVTSIGSERISSAQISIRNGQRQWRIPSGPMRQLVREVLAERGQTAEVAIHWIGPRRSAEMNRQFLQHEGPTDIITFDYGSTPECLRGELFICVSEAVRQAREFGTTWKQELRRYVIHGLLHLRGYDDRDARTRQRMKRAENRLVRRFA